MWVNFGKGSCLFSFEVALCIMCDLYGSLFVYLSYLANCYSKWVVQDVLCKALLSPPHCRRKQKRYMQKKECVIFIEKISVFFIQ